jgi:hypothetical protein
MEEIRKFVDEMITWAGVTGDFVPMLRHILLTITAILLAMLSDFLCRKILVPLISKITDKTDITWDDVLLNKKVLTSACHIVPAVVIWSLMPLIYLEYPIFKEILERVTGIYIVVMSVRTALVFIGSFKGLEDSQERRSSAQQYFHTFCGVLRVLMLFVAAVVVIAILLGKNPMTLFAGLGATSAVLMLVFKDTITGLAAGVRLTSKEGHRVLVQQDGNHHHSSHEEHQYPENTAESMEILLSRRASFLRILQSFERPDEDQSRTHRHHHDIDARSPLQYLLEYRILQINQRHERPYHHSRHNMASRGEHLLVQQHIIPSDVRLISNLTDERNQYLATKKIAQHRQENGSNGEQDMAQHGHKITGDSCPCYHFIYKLTNFLHKTINYQL